MTLAQKILQVRLDLDLTQEKLAQELGTWPSAVSNWEKGKNGVSARTAWKLSKISGKDLNYFLEQPNTESEIRKAAHDA